MKRRWQGGSRRFLRRCSEDLVYAGGDGVDFLRMGDCGVGCGGCSSSTNFDKFEFVSIGS